MSIIKPYTFVAGNKARANEVNEDFDVLYQQVNTNITNIANAESELENLDATKADINGSSSQRFAVADPVSPGHAVNKRYLLTNGLPVGFVVYYAYEEVPDGYLICDGSAISRTTYSELFSVIGTIFGAGDSSTTFNIPDLLDKFIEGDTTVGTSKAAGVPNITGCGGSTVKTPPASGAMYYTSDTGGLGSGGWAIANMYFDASRSSAIYGASSTVQPPALTLLPIIKY